MGNLPICVLYGRDRHNAQRENGAVSAADQYQIQSTRTKQKEKKAKKERQEKKNLNLNEEKILSVNERRAR